MFCEIKCFLAKLFVFAEKNQLLVSSKDMVLTVRVYAKRPVNVAQSPANFLNILEKIKQHQEKTAKIAKRSEKKTWNSENYFISGNLIILHFNCILCPGWGIVLHTSCKQDSFGSHLTTAVPGTEKYDNNSHNSNHIRKDYKIWLFLYLYTYIFFLYVSYLFLIWFSFCAGDGPCQDHIHLSAFWTTLGQLMTQRPTQQSSLQRNAKLSGLHSLFTLIFCNRENF